MITAAPALNAYLSADRVLGTILDEVPPGLILSIDIGGSLFDTLCKTAAKASSHEMAEFPSLVRYRAHLQGYPQPLRPVDVADEPILFGRVDGTLCLHDDSSIFESYSPRFDAFSTRSVDDWRMGRPPLRHIHFGDQLLVMDQIAGATGVLQRDRPTLSLYSAGLDRSELLSILHNHGYNILDIEGAPVRTESASLQCDFGWIAVPEEREIRVPALRATNGDGADLSVSQLVMDRNAPARHLRSRAVFGFSVEPPNLSSSLQGAEIMAVDDCYATETDGAGFWRWLGPRPRTRLLVPCVLPGVYSCEIAVASTQLQSGLAACRVLVQGREVRAAPHGEDFGTIRFMASLEPRDYSGYLTIDVVSPGALKPASVVTQAPRLKIQSVAIVPWP